MHLFHSLIDFLLICARRAHGVLTMQRRGRPALREHGVRGLLMLALLLHAILVRVILPLLLKFEAFLASTADLFCSLRLVLKLRRSRALGWPWRGDEGLPILAAVYDYC